MSGPTTRKKTPKKNVSKEALKVTALKKRETTIRAMTIIEKMIDGMVDEKYLLESVHFISQDQYQDIIEERAITKLCGYPLCSLALKDVPAKIYHISTKQNKVYDITERKNFCSNGCYKASVFLKNQLLTSPLWLREVEDKPDYRVIHLNDGGGLGDEVDLGHKRVQLKDVFVPGDIGTGQGSGGNAPPKTSKTHQSGAFLSSSERSKKNDCDSITETCSSTNEEISAEATKRNIEKTDNQSEQSSETLKQKSTSEKIVEKESTGTTLERNENRILDEGSLNTIERVQTDCVEINGTKNRTNTITASVENSEVKETLLSRQLEYSKIEVAKDMEEEPIVVNETKSCLNESKMLDHESAKNECSSEESTSKVPLKDKSDLKKESVFKKERHKTKKTAVKQEEQKKIDRKMVLLEIVKHIEKCLREWITFDTLILLLGDETVKNLMTSKGKEFKECQNFCGADASTYEKYLSICRKLNLLELEDAQIDMALKEKNADLKPLPDYSILQREAKQLEIKARSFYEGSMMIESVEPIVENSSEKDETTVVLPLVDLHAQKALRRRIVLDRLNVTLPDLGRTLNLGIFNLSSTVRHLSQTFNFSSHNITFKPQEWYFIAMVLVKLLSLQDRTLKTMLETDTSEKYLTLLLMNWGLDAGYLDRLVTWLTDVDYLIQKTECV